MLPASIRAQSSMQMPMASATSMPQVKTGPAEVSLRIGPVLVDVPMDIFSADLPENAFQSTPPVVTRPTIDPETAASIVEALAQAERPVIYAGGGVLSSRASAELR